MKIDYFKINIIEFDEKNMIIHSNNFDFKFVWSDVLKDSNNKNKFR